MLRSGLRSHAPNADFFSDEVSSEDLLLHSDAPRKSTVAKKTRRKKLSKKSSIGFLQQSADEQPTPSDDRNFKKKKSKKTKKTDSISDGEAVAGEGRKIVQGKRRIQRQENIDSSSPPTKFKSPPSTKTRSLKKSSLKPLQQDSDDILVEVNLNNSLKKSPVANTPAHKKVTQRRARKNKENEFHLAEESALKKCRSIIELREDENKIVTSVQKYTENHWDKFFDKSYNITFDDENLNLRSSTRRGTYEIGGIEPNRKSGVKSPRDSRRSTFNIDKSGINTKKRTLEAELDSPLKGVIQTTKKRSIVDLRSESLEPSVNKSVHNESLVANKVKQSPTVKDGNRSERRRTFDVNANGILPKSPEKLGSPGIDAKSTIAPVELDDTVLRRQSRTSRRSSIKPEVKKAPAVVARRSLSSMHRKKLEKIRISESKTSLSESGVSSPSIVFRRALRINPPTRTSTPKASHLKSVAISPKTKKTPQPSASKVRKVPNYNLIHQNAFNKMESIDDHLERKAMRAKALLSGQKALNQPNPKVVTLDAKSKKQLNFTSDKMHFKFNNKTSNSPVVFVSSRQMSAGDAPVALEGPPKRTRNAMKVGFNVSTPVKRVETMPMAKTPRPTKAEIWNAYGTKIPRPAAPLFTTGAKSAGDAIATEAILPVRVATRNMNRRKEAASVSTKSKTSSTTVDSRRDHIKGVRSNRRFDLLMSMRK